MARKVQHSLLDRAKVNRNDEFYTQLCDIENELQHYVDKFKGKTVFCNCDDVLKSNFYRYFVNHFFELGLKKLICACYVKNDDSLFSNCEWEQGYCYIYTGKNKKWPLVDDLRYFSGDGDFRSAESVALLQEADIVVTNPPFSLFREYVEQLMLYGKDFLIIGNVNAITYKEVFTQIQKGKIWLGINLGRGISGFIVPKEYEMFGTETKIDGEGNKIVSTNSCLWLTTLDNYRRHESIDLTERYCGNECKYPFYDNFDGINIDKTKDIPMDYCGVMGVPITFLHRHNPDQFEIVRFRKGDDGKDLSLDGKNLYFRILIRNKLPVVVE